MTLKQVHAMAELRCHQMDDNQDRVASIRRAPSLDEHRRHEHPISFGWGMRRPGGLVRAAAQESLSVDATNPEVVA